MQYTVIVIRDFPDFVAGWRGAYLFGAYATAESAIDDLKTEIKNRGGKYGGIVIYPGGTILSLDIHGNEL